MSFGAKAAAEKAPRRLRPASAQSASQALTLSVGSLNCGSLLQRKASCACGGGCPRCSGHRTLQRELRISTPGDALEREADRVAEAVVDGGSASVTRAHGPTGVQRSCACSGSSADEERCDSCREKEEELLRRSADHEAGAQGFAPAIVHEVLRSSGQPLDPATRAFFEPRFAREFSDVRVHTGPQADESARAVNALAYTVGRDVVFGSGQFAPGTAAGDRVLAHELTHVLQQQGTTASNTGLQKRALQRQSAAAQHTLPFSGQPVDLQSVFANTWKENSSEKEPLVCIGQADVATCFNGLSVRDRSTIVGIYQRMSRFGLWPHVHHFRKVWYNVVGGVEMTVTDGLKLLEDLLKSPFFCIDKPEGALLHPGATSIREISSIDSLHLSIGSLNRVTAHIDAISPAKGREPGGYCQYDPIRSQAHIGREVVPLLVPKFQIFPEQAPAFGPPGQQQPTPPIVGFEFRF